MESENTIFIVIYLDDNTPGLADDFANSLADADPVGTEVVFAEDGSATGGFYDMLPEADDAVVAGLIPYQDVDLFSELQAEEGL